MRLVCVAGEGDLMRFFDAAVVDVVREDDAFEAVLDGAFEVVLDSTCNVISNYKESRQGKGRHTLSASRLDWRAGREVC